MSTDRPGAGPPSDVPDDDAVVSDPSGSAAGPEVAPAGAAATTGADVTGSDVPDADAGAGAGAVEGAGPEAVGTEEPEASGKPASGKAAAGEGPQTEGPPTETSQATPVTARRRRTRDPLAAALIGVLTLLLGFAFAVQVRAVGHDQEYGTAREEDLVRILDSLNAREERLRQQISDQRTALAQLSDSDSQLATALEEARAQAEAIGILNGTIPARGPGLVMTVHDPEDTIRVADVLDAIQELRGAGAETMQIDGIRVGVSTAVTGEPGNLMIDGRPITAPYEFLVIGSPQNMETAMNIPGGVAPRVTSRGGSVDIRQPDEVVVDALRPLDTPQYAEPDTED